MGMHYIALDFRCIEDLKSKTLNDHDTDFLSYFSSDYTNLTATVKTFG